MRRAKYGNRKTEVDGHMFDSKAEAARYQDLKLMQRAGAIRGLELQPRWELVVNGVRIGRYTGDFRYEDTRTSSTVIEDVKGMRSRDYILRKKLMLACHGIDVQEIVRRGR